MKNGILRLVIIAILFTGGQISAQQKAEVLNLQDCIKIASDKSTTIIKGNNSVALSGAQLLAAYGQFLPNLVAGAGINYNGGNNFYSAAGPELVNLGRSQYNYQLASSLNLFSGYNNYASWKAAKLNQQMATLSLERARQQIELDITQSYLQVILDKKLVELDSANLVTSLKREDQLAMLTEVGRKSGTDLYQQQAQTSNDKLTLINAKGRLQNDKIILFQKLRIDSAENYELADIPVNDNAEASRYGNRDALVSQALQDRADYRSAQLNTQYADFLIKKYRSGYLPNVSLTGGIYNNGAWFNSLSINGNKDMPASQDAIPTQLYKYTYGLVGINASWNLFDRYLTKTNVAAAKIVADNAHIDYQDTKINIVASIKKAYNDYINAVQQIETVDKGLIAAQKAFEAVNGRYKEGAADFITVSNAQIVLLQAQQNKIQASVNMMLQKKVIDYYVGAGR